MKKNFIAPLLFIAAFLALIMNACAAQGTEIKDSCGLAPVVVPTLPAFIPEEFELDPTTNLHKSGDPQKIDIQTYTLKVTGMVDHELALTFDQLRCLPKIVDSPTLTCPQTFIDKAEWAGVRVATILKLAGVQDGAGFIRMTGADGYHADMTLEDAMQPGNFLAYEWEGEPLPIMHGFPVRAVFPDIYGSQWVKWLLEIEVK